VRGPVQFTADFRGQTAKVAFVLEKFQPGK
jgi:hypothetical protein